MLFKKKKVTETDVIIFKLRNILIWICAYDLKKDKEAKKGFKNKKPTENDMSIYGDEETVDDNIEDTEHMIKDIRKFNLSKILSYD